MIYKLTDQNYQTQGGFTYTIGEWAELTPCNNPQLCSSDVLHAYTNINLAFLLNPIHADINNPRLLECDGEIAVSDWGKIGCFSLLPVRELEFPAWVNSNLESDTRMQFAILCAEEVLTVFENQYPDDDKPRKAIQTAKDYLNYRNTYAAAHTVYAHAAEAAAHAAYAAAYAAAHADVYDAAYAVSAAHAAHAAADAAYAVSAAYSCTDTYPVAVAAANAATHAATTGADINFEQLADLAAQMILGE